MKTRLEVLVMAAALLGGVGAAQAEVQWTNWLDRDGPNGSGDWESRYAFYDDGSMPCQWPVDMQARRISDGADALDVDKNYYAFRPSGGFACRHADQTTGNCPDFAVRFACPQSTRTQLPTAGFGQAMHFDGVDDRVVVFGAMDALTSATVQLRVMPLDLRAAPLLQLDGRDLVRIDGEGRVELVLDGGSTITAGEALALVEWAHVAVTFDAATGEAALYVDGARVGAGGAVDLSGDLTLAYDTTGGSHFKGRLDELRIFDFARAGADIAHDHGLTPDAAGLVMHLGFEESDGVPLNSLTVDSNIAMAGDPARVSAVNRYASGTGASSRFRVDGAAWADRDDFTWMGWFKVEGTGGAYLLRRGNNTTFCVHSGSTRLATYALEGGYLGAPTAVPQGEWTHAAFTWHEATGTYTIYMNGQQVAQRSGDVLRMDSGTMDMGISTKGIDDVRLFGRVLTAAEIQAQMASVLSGNEADLVAGYNLDEPGGQVAVDVTGHYDASFYYVPARGIHFGDEALVTSPASDLVVEGTLPLTGGTIEIVDGPEAGTLVVDPATGAFTYTREVNSPTDAFTYRVTDGIHTSGQRLVKLGEPTILTVPITTITPYRIEPTVELTVEPAAPLQTTVIDLSYSAGDDPLVFTNGGPGTGAYSGDIRISLGGRTLTLDFDGVLDQGNDFSLEDMSGVARVVGSTLPMLADLVAPGDFVVGYDHPSAFDDGYDFPLDPNRRYIYMIYDAQDSISWGSSSISGGVGATAFVIDHIDPAVLVYSEVFQAVGLGDYVSDAGFGISDGGHFLLSPTESWQNEGFIGEQRGHVYAGVNGSIPTRIPGLSVTCDGQVVVDVDDSADRDLGGFMTLPRGWLANGDFGVSYGQGMWGISWQLGSATAQYDRDGDWLAISGHLDPETLVIIPDVLEIDLDENALAALRFEGEQITHGSIEGNFTWNGVDINGTLTMGNTGGSFQGHMNLAAITVEVSGGFDEDHAEVTGAIDQSYSLDVLGSVSLEGYVTVGTHGAAADLGVGLCLPFWAGGGCVSVGTTVSYVGNTFKACADLPLVGEKCFSL